MGERILYEGTKVQRFEVYGIQRVLKVGKAFLRIIIISGKYTYRFKNLDSHPHMPYHSEFYKIESKEKSKEQRANSEKS